ncbi:MAG: glycoside hydrolase family protein [Eubacteriales bacterium]|nr:glycoside hydrolase family protein [Eubacteriales bacterium]
MTIKELLIKHEGKSRKPYPDNAIPPRKTIGIGYNFTDNPLPEDIAAYLKKNGQITDEMIDRLLFISIGAATMDCHKLFPDFDKFSENRRMALVDFLFNLGFKRASGFRHMIAAVNTGRWHEAAKEMKNSAWATQVQKSRVDDLTEMIEEG